MELDEVLGRGPDDGGPVVAVRRLVAHTPPVAIGQFFVRIATGAPVPLAVAAGLVSVPFQVSTVVRQPLARLLRLTKRLLRPFAIGLHAFEPLAGFAPRLL